MKQAASVIFRTVILLLAGITIGLLISKPGYLARTVNGNHKIDSILYVIKHHYVDNVATDTLEIKAINSVLTQLDPHSVFLPRQQAQTVNEKLEGTFNGLGIEYVLLRDTMFITQVYPGSPAAGSGLVNGDRVITINQHQIAGKPLTTDFVNQQLKGEQGSHVIMEVKRNATPGFKKFNLIRGPVPLSSLDAAYNLNQQTGYVKLSKFASTTDTDFRKAVNQMKSTGVNQLVLDLRGNRGGYLGAATALADEFLTKGKLIVFTKGAHEERTDYFATDSGIFQQGKLALLIDEYSASASEIVAGAIQDLDRGVLVGRRSFGKGLVQQQFVFGDGSALNLSVARYYTPSGRSIQKSYKDGIEEYRKEIGDREQKGELTSAEKNLCEDAFKTKAFHTQSGRRVYGGGGIMPDVFVPDDPATNVALLGELSHNQLYTAYAIDHLQPVLSSFSVFDEYIKDFTVSDARVDEFIVYASKTLKEMDSAEIKLAKPYIKLYLKAFAARFKWGNSAYFKVLNQNDTAISKALAAIK